MRRASLTGVDNITGSSGGDLFVAEDGAPPDRTRFYFSSQRGTTGAVSGGITYAVTGPFRA